MCSKEAVDRSAGCASSSLSGTGPPRSSKSLSETLDAMNVADCFIFPESFSDVSISQSIGVFQQLYPGCELNTQTFDLALVT